MTRVLGLLVAAALLAATAATSDSRATWTGAVANSADTAGAGTLAVTHTYGSGSCTSAPAGSVPYGTEIACPGSVAPTAAVPASGSVSGTDTIAYSGTLAAAQLTEQVRVESCGPVRFTNRITATNPMLARYGTAFATSGGPMDSAGYVTLDGADPGAYASSIVAQSQPQPLLSLGQRYGLGIWFQTSSSAGGPLFGFGDSPINATGQNDRILSMDAAGHLRFTYNLSGLNITTSATFNDGQWHYAYLTLSQVSVLFIGLIPSVTLYVDGTQVAQTGLVLLSGFSSYSGYWHLGWSPLAGLPDYFTGSLSNFAVLNTSPAPATMAAPATQAAFNTAVSSSVTEHWLLNDPGTTTYTGTLPVIGTTDPCSMVAGQWGFTNPTSCAWSPQSTSAACSTTSSLAQMVADSWRQVAAPEPSTSQTGTLSTSRGGTYNASYLPGLRLYMPLLFRSVTTVGSWGNTFAWRSPSSVVLG
jgi:hypothetical protein